MKSQDYLWLLIAPMTIMAIGLSVAMKNDFGLIALLLTLISLPKIPIALYLLWKLNNKAIARF
jgi:hypothetical protein